MGQRPAGTVTFLFTDIEGSTRLWDSAPDSMRGALECHDAVLKRAFESHGGYVFSTGGDGYGVAFARVGDALAAAVEVQEALAAEPWPDGAAIRVRMGLHTGEAVSERDGDYFGTAVNRGARLMAVAHGGQVVCSRATAGLAGDVVHLRSLGEHRLRDLAAAEQVFQVGDGSFPPLRSVDAVPTNLPTVRTELIGRTEEVTTLMELVERERLVTLTGVGGVGKTRLALGVAAAIAAGFADGCWLVELSPVADGDEVVKTVAAAMRAPTTTAEAVVDYLADRQMLIVLDNCEHVLDAAADLVDAIEAAAPDVHVLVTSREPLGLDGEQVRRVQSLALPDAVAASEEARATAAVRLFTERAAAVRDGFVVDAGNVAAVVEICRHLDGIPLAIELAAARARAMAPAEIARRLDERFRLLAGGSRRAQERHRTLFATVSWSHDLLTDEERIVFRRLAVFPASFDLAAAEAVADDGAVDVVDCVLRLVDRSLVVYEPDQDRYRLLETLRQYGADRLAETGETEKIRERHARYFLAFAERMSHALNDARYATARATVGADVDNVRATADWCTDMERQAELAAMCQQLWFFFQQTSPADVAVWYRHVVEHDSEVDDQVLVDCLGELAYLQALTFGDYTGADELAERSHRHAGANGVRESAMAWIGIASAAIYTGRNADALRASERGVAAAEGRDDERAAVTALLNEAGALAAGGVDEAERGTALAAEVLRRAEHTGHPILISAAVITAASTYLQRSGAPDFAASFELLDRHPIEQIGSDLNDTWLDVTWGLTLLGLDRPEAVGRLACAARTADRLNSPNLLDYTLRQLAVAAAEAGLTGQATALVDYTELNLRPHRFDIRSQAYLQARLDRALPDLAGRALDSQLHRRDILTLVTEIEAAVESGRTASVTPG